MCKSKFLPVLVLSLSAVGVAAAKKAPSPPPPRPPVTHPPGVPRMAAPEIDPASVAAAMALLIGGLAVLRGRQPDR